MSSRRNDALNTSRKHREVMGDLKNTQLNKKKKKIFNWDEADETLIDAFREGNKDNMEAYLSKLGKDAARHRRHPLRNRAPTGVANYDVYNKGGKKRKSRKTKKSKKSRKSRKTKKSRK